MVGSMLETELFAADALLVKHNNGSKPTTRRAALGLLLNRVKRMRADKAARVEIVCGGRVYRHPDMLGLLDSDGYKKWLAWPSRFNGHRW
jgi:hypothetical protein